LAAPSEVALRKPWRCGRACGFAAVRGRNPSAAIRRRCRARPPAVSPHPALPGPVCGPRLPGGPAHLPVQAPGGL
jgi:hypothetical protein